MHCHWLSLVPDFAPWQTLVSDLGPNWATSATLPHSCNAHLLSCWSLSAVMADSHQWEMEMEGLQIDIWEVKVIPGRVFLSSCLVLSLVMHPLHVLWQNMSFQTRDLDFFHNLLPPFCYIPFQISIHCEDKFINNVRIAGRKNAMRRQQLWTVFAGNIQSRVISPRNEGNNSPNSPSPLSSTSPSAK